jgi:transposase
MAFQGKEFTSEMVQLVVNLKQSYDAESRVGPVVSTSTPVKRVANGLGIGEATVKRIMARYNKDGQKVIIPAYKPRGKPEYRVSTNLQPIIRAYIRSENLKGQRVGVEKVRTYLIKDYEAEISLATLWRCLKRWGFVHGTGKNRSTLKERPYVILARRKYLRAKRANRNLDSTLKRPEVYIDETYINKNHSSRFTWYLEQDGPWVNKPSGKGPRFIIVHAITKDGWVDGADLVFEAKKRTGDYHGQMDWENFSKWLSNQLLPNIAPSSLIIMDNAKYHNVLVDEAFPSSTTTKQQMQDWLTKNNYAWTEDMLKSELFQMCKRLAPVPEFKLDKIAEAHGHKILRTPQYHPELQPIETCWAVVKNYMADKCDFTMASLKKNLPDAFAKVTPSTCEKIISKVVEQEEKYWIEDGEIEEIDIELEDDLVELEHDGLMDENCIESY